MSHCEGLSPPEEEVAALHPPMVEVTGDDDEGEVASVGRLQTTENDASWTTGWGRGAGWELEIIWQRGWLDMRH